MLKFKEKETYNKFKKIDQIENELRVLKAYVFKVYPIEEKELFDAYQEILSGQTATIDDLINDLKKDKHAQNKI